MYSTYSTYITHNATPPLVEANVAARPRDEAVAPPTLSVVQWVAFPSKYPSLDRCSSENYKAHRPVFLSAGAGGGATWARGRGYSISCLPFGRGAVWMHDFLTL